MTQPTVPPSHCDIAIVGGGPVGLFLARALGGSGRSVVLLEAERAPREQDPRMLAVSAGSIQLLEQVHAWQASLTDSPIRTVYVSQSGHFGRARLTADSIGLDALGYVVPYVSLHPVLAQGLPSNVQMVAGARVESIGRTPSLANLHFQQDGTPGTLTARLVIIADGGMLAESLGFLYREHDYGQTALLAQVDVGGAPADTAFERFTPDGALALLPRPGGYSVVWSRPRAAAEALSGASDDAFLTELQAAVGSRPGRIQAVRARQSWPLRLRYATHSVSSRVVVIGNAAQSLHPIAGQGLNLGLRDAWELAAQLRAAPHDVGAATVLNAYARGRGLDQLNGVGFTDSLIRLFGLPHLGHARGAGLAAFDMMPAVKRQLLGHLAYGVRHANP